MSSEKIVIKAETRETSKAKLRSLRAAEMIPAVMYRKGGNLNLAISVRNLPKGHTWSKPLSVEVDNKTITAIMREVQVDPLTNKPRHIDLQEVDTNAVISSILPIEYVGLTKEQEKDATFRPLLRSIKLTGVVSAFPEKLTVNVSSLVVDATLHLEGSQLPTGLRLQAGTRRPAIAQLIRK